MTRAFALSIMLLGAAPAWAGPLTVRITDPSGKPVPNAVVSLPSGRPGNGGRFVVSQKNLAFHPFVVVVPVGASVSFPNFDDTRHHVYSFSTAKRFELKLFAKEQSRSIIFDRPGIVALGCNIHDRMSAFIVVTDRTQTALTDANGVARLQTAPGSAATKLSVWHPYLRSPANRLDVSVFPNETSKVVQVRLRPAPIHGMGGY